jgi:DNA repair protein RadC
VITIVEKTTSTSGTTGGDKYKDTDLKEVCRKDAHTLLAKCGPEELTPQELLEVLISPTCKKEKASDIVKDLWETFHNNLIDILTAPIEQLTQVKGIGFARACQIKASFELWKRAASYFEDEHPVIDTKEDVIHLLGPHMVFMKQEAFVVILLDKKNRLIRYHQISLGSLDAALVHPRDVFRHALYAGAPSIIVVHNHPSGDPTPSEQDILLTRELLMCSKIMNIEILDHVIIGFPEHVSFKERGLM